MQRGAVLLLAAAAIAARPSPARADAHVVLVSIDGMRGDYLWDERYHLNIPHLRALRARGSFAERALGVTPTLTYPSHASIVTGVYPARHGVDANLRFQPERWRAGEDGYDAQDGYWEAAAIRARTLWQAAREKGLVTAAFAWPSTLGAPIDWLYVRPPARYRPEATDRRALLREVSTRSLVDRFEEEVGRLDTRDARLRDHYLAIMAARVIERERPHLVLIHFSLADGTQHRYGPATREALAAVEDVDQNVGLLVDAVERAGIAATTTFVVTGDHGHLPLHTQIGPNIALVEAGLIELDAEGRIAEWKAIASAARPFAPVYVRDASLVPRVRALFGALAARHGSVFRVVDREELDGLGVDAKAALGLEAEPGFTFDDRLAGPLLVPHDRKSGHGWTPETPGIETTFLAAGRGIRRGVRLGRVRLVDIAPTVARLLGLDLPGTDGAPIEAVLATESSAAP